MSTRSDKVGIMSASEDQRLPSFEEISKGLLEEYKTIRGEILQTQGQRIQIISPTVGAIGVILSISFGLVLRAQATSPDKLLMIAVGAAIVIYVILIPSLIMMISVQQAIQRLGGYIRLFIEPQVPGLNWENRIQKFKLQTRFAGGLRGMGAMYYFLAILPWFLPLYFLSHYPKGWPILLILVPLFGWSIYLGYDLRAGSSKGWRLARWTDRDGNLLFNDE
jgi:hypothetical protein